MDRAKGFSWDKGNLEKNWLKHGVSREECEQVFFHKPLIVFPDTKHSEREDRYYVLGITSLGRYLFVVYTMRDDLIRVISARDMSRKERSFYGN